MRRNQSLVATQNALLKKREISKLWCAYTSGILTSCVGFIFAVQHKVAIDIIITSVALAGFFLVLNAKNVLLIPLHIRELQNEPDDYALVANEAFKEKLLSAYAALMVKEHPWSDDQKKALHELEDALEMIIPGYYDRQDAIDKAIAAQNVAAKKPALRIVSGEHEGSVDDVG